MRILFLGDIMGRSGREAVALHLPDLKEKLRPDAIIVNAENAAHGDGITEKICDSLFALGVDCITTGNHVWGQREAIGYIGREPRLLRPLNYPAGTPGNGLFHKTFPDGRSLVILNAMGRQWMEALDCPFTAIQKVLETETMGRSANAIFLDFHADATSEKMAMGHFLDGRVSAVVGTHTHIPTADAWVLPGGTAYQTDAGMCGDYDSCIGVRKDIPIHKFIRKMPGERFVPADGLATVCGVFVVTDDRSGHALSIAPVRVGPRLIPTRPEEFKSC